MKTITTIIITAVLALTINFSVASKPIRPAFKSTVIEMLAPVTPMEATFEDEIISDYSHLAPVVPMTADFE